MSTHRITYEGPSSLAVPTVTRLAEADGVELTASTAPEHRAPEGDEVVLALTVEGSRDAIEAAVASIRDALPLAASITIAEPS